MHSDLGPLPRSLWMDVPSREMPASAGMSGGVRSHLCNYLTYISPRNV